MTDVNLVMFLYTCKTLVHFVKNKPKHSCKNYYFHDWFKLIEIKIYIEIYSTLRMNGGKGRSNRTKILRILVLAVAIW